MRPKSSDPKEQDLRDRWHEAREKWVSEGMPSSSPTKRAFDHVDRILSDYLWNRAKDDVEEDRRRHPKAKRNLPVGAEVLGQGRALP